MKANKKCNLCNGERVKEISTMTRYGVPARTVICKNCGLVYIDDKSTTEDLAQYYDQDYRDQYTNVDIESENYSQLKLNTIDKFMKFIPENARVLEIGCANGLLLKRLKELRSDVEVYGIEPSSKLQDLAQANGVRILASLVEDYDISNALKFDFIVLDHVFEHFSNPKENLFKLRDMLTESGRIYIEVPDILNPHCDLEHSFFQHVHLYNFSKQTISILFRELGFKVLQERKARYMSFVVEKSEERFDFCSCDYGQAGDSYKSVADYLEIYKSLFRYKGSKCHEIKDKQYANIETVDLGLSSDVKNIRLKAHKERISDMLSLGKDDLVAKEIADYFELLDLDLVEVIKLLKLGKKYLERSGDDRRSKKYSRILKWVAREIEN